MKKATRKQLGMLRRRRLALALVGAMAMPGTALAQNLPNTGTVVPNSGAATITQDGNQITITQTTKGAIIDWGSFSIGSGYGVDFDQQFGNTSVTLNRVVGYAYGTGGCYNMGGCAPAVTSIGGSLTANGSVFIINPAGIVFGSGAQVNVGGLMASTIDISNDDFLAGINSGHYQFQSVPLVDTDNDGTNDSAVAGSIYNLGHIGINRQGGTVAFLGSNLVNYGTIDAPGGSVVFGSAQQVTLDFYGDGLTQVTVGGTSLRHPPECDPTVTCTAVFAGPGMIRNTGTVTADGGQILMRAVGATGNTNPTIWNSGVLQAHSLTSRNGRIELTAPGGSIVLGPYGTSSPSPYIGSIDVSGSAGANGGDIIINGGTFSMASGQDPLDTNPDNLHGSWMGASGNTGGNITIATTGDVSADYLSRIEANGVNGQGGHVQLLAGGSIDLTGTTVGASSKTGSGGNILLQSSAGDIEVFVSNIVANGGGGSGGTVGLVASMGDVDIGGGDSGDGSYVMANGATDGGQVKVEAAALSLDGYSQVSAIGSGGAGGLVDLNASGTLIAYGLLAASGGTAGGTVNTTSAGAFDIRGLSVRAGADNGALGQWTLTAPEINVVDGSEIGSIYDPLLGFELQDAEINGALSSGTNVTLRAGVNPTDSGNVTIGTGVAIGHDSQVSPETFRIDANGSISGQGFSIGLANSALNMIFNADASGANANGGGIRFSEASFDSKGGDILMYGQSDAVAGRASGADNGIALLDVDIATDGGDVLLRGASTGASSAIGDAGVYMDGTDIIAGTGSVTIDGVGAGSAWGVDITSGTITSAGGAIGVSGTAADALGIRIRDSQFESGAGGITLYGASTGSDAVALDNSSFITTSGDISIEGTGDDEGVRIIQSLLQTDSGSVSLVGTGRSGHGVDLRGTVVSTQGGGISLQGNSEEDTGVLVGGAGEYSSLGLWSNGGDIDVVGNGYAAGVILTQGYVGSYSVGDNTLNSAGGAITVTGTASADDGDAIGVLISGVQLVGGTGDVTVTGSAPAGTGLAFEQGYWGASAGISTTTGAIGLYGTGARFGLDIGDGAIDTDSGDITLEGEATAADASAGVRVMGEGLYTSGGDITVRGTSAGGVGVQLGDGSDPFAVDSGGGAILIDGTGVDAGVLMQNNQVTSAGGAVAITGAGGALGVSLAGGSVDSAGGAIGIEGTASDADGIGVLLDQAQLTAAAGDITITGTAEAGTGVSLGGGGITTTSGAISVTSTGLHGLNASDVPFSTGTGSIHLEGHAQEGEGLYLGSGGLTTHGGDITLVGETADDGEGVQIGGDIASNGGAIYIHGTSGSTFDFNHGVLIQGGTSLDSGGGDIHIAGETAGGIGIWVDGVDIASNGGDVVLDGSSTGTTAYTHGVSLSRGASIDSAGGDIRITGSSAGAGVLVFGDVALNAASGDIVIDGTSSLDGNLSSGIRIFEYNGGSTITTTTGSIRLTGTAAGTGAIGVNLGGVALASGAGDIHVMGSAVEGTGILFGDGAGIRTATGAIGVTGIGADIGLSLDGGELSTDSGHIDLRGRGMGTSSSGLLIGDGARIATAGGGIELSGEGGSGAGIALGTGSLVDAGDSLVILRAGNDGSSDAIRLQGAIHSGIGVNLRPGGVDANGQIHDRVDDEILIGGGNGFALDGAELAGIDAPELVLGSRQHAGAIRVLAATGRDGNLTLQNEGGSGGIDVQAALGVGDHTLSLATGGSITQTAAGAITAHSLLAMAAGDVLLAAAQNDVASTTLAGSAGGDFEFLDANDLAIGSVSGMGMDASTNQLAGMGSTGVGAGNDVLVRNLDGDLTLGADVSGTNIDLVTAGRLQNPGGAALNASGDWRVWAATWEGETRGGLAGSGDLPNLYGCLYLGACGVTVTGGDNHFIYVQQPVATIAFNDATREYGLDNPAFGFTVTGAILGDTAANVASGTASTTATIGSDVGLYAITGNFTSAAGYRIELVPGTLSITPATLLFTADSFIRYLGSPNPEFTGEVTGFRNGDTVESVFGSGSVWSSPAGPLSPVGFYPVVGGTSAKNYVFAQAPGNATALQVIPLPQLSSTPVDFLRESVDTYVYDRNFGTAPVCAVNASIDDQALASVGDGLATEWSKVRTRPNLTNCFDSDRRSACGDF